MAALGQKFLDDADLEEAVVHYHLCSITKTNLGDFFFGSQPAQVGCLFTFLARQMAKNDNNIIVNRLLFEQVLKLRQF